VNNEFFEHKVNPDVFDHGSWIKHRESCRFGNFVVLDIGVVSSVTMDIGDWVHIAPYSVIIGGKESQLTMGHFSGISAGCKIICGGDDFASGALMNPQVPVEFREPIITSVNFEAFSCTGVNAVVMPGVTLHEGAVVGSNSVLTRDAEPWTIYIGSPARPIRDRPRQKAYEYAKKLGYDFD
jgi:acetyltransferase-like isoleucine patch superfamily enzyme